MEESKEIFEIFAGTYEEYLLGFKFYKNDDDKDYKLEQTVAEHSHKGSLRTISSKGYLLATGGFDEIIHVYNLDENREIGTLSQHTGTVSCVSFTSDEKHLISCSEDGSIAIYRVGSWIMEKLWSKAHKGTCVNWIAVHPSNKLALSVGNDGKIRTWNLITGTAAYETDVSHLSKRPEFVVWSKDGQFYALPHDNQISVFSVSKAGVEHSFKLESKVTCALFLEIDVLCVGDMGGNLVLFQVSTGKLFKKVHVSDSRIKAAASHHRHLIVSTSEGLIAVYELEDKNLKEIAKSDSSCRITCITIACHCCRRERKQKNKKAKANGEVKTEISNKVLDEIQKKRMKAPDSLNLKKKLKCQSKVVCSPRRQSWIVEEQKT